MGTSFFEPGDFTDFFEKVPAAFFKSIGLVGVANFLGGVLAGMMLPEFRAEQRRYSAAGYGAFVLAIDIARFVPVADFKQEADRTMRDLHGLPPWPGYERYDLPGGPERERERRYAEEGIPVGPGHRKELEAIAGELGAEVPWN
jgi:LDH2 family malate/lactate/ureidoglycolate dehydrogenase